MVWYFSFVLRLLPAAISGNDPATYMQSGLDLAQRGTVVRDARELGLLADPAREWLVLIPPGYRYVEQTGAVVPVFALGLPALLALAARLGGLVGMIWVTPLLGALALVATTVLGLELFAPLPLAMRAVISILGALFLATNFKQMTLVLVPMSDVPAQLLSVTALIFGLRMYSTGHWIWALSAGLALGAGYWMRHTALLMLVPLLVLFFASKFNGRSRWALFTVFAIGLGWSIIPDLVYHIRFLGGILEVESPGSNLTNWLGVPGTGLTLISNLLSARGFGPLLLLALPGIWAMRVWQTRVALYVLSSWTLIFALFHLPLILTASFENDLRYVLPAFPALALLTSAGIIYSWDVISTFYQRGNGFRVISAAAALALVVAVLLTVRLLGVTSQFSRSVYGWVGPMGYDSLVRLPALLPENAVVATDDQDATAIVLYSERTIVRLAQLSNGQDELDRLASRLQAQNRFIYVVGDPECASAAPPSGRLPEWLAASRLDATGQTLDGVSPYCRDKLYRLKPRT